LEEVPFLLQVEEVVVVLSFLSLLPSEKVPFLLNTKKICKATQSVIIISYCNYSGTCLICHTKGPEKCVRLYRMSEPV
jgi:hypothetical protein